MKSLHFEHKSYYSLHFVYFLRYTLGSVAYIKLAIYKLPYVQLPYSYLWSATTHQYYFTSVYKMLCAPKLMPKTYKPWIHFKLIKVVKPQPIGTMSVCVHNVIQGREKEGLI